MDQDPGELDDRTREAQRLEALHGLSLLDTEPQREFDALVALAADMLGCPTAMLTLVDRDRQWVKACSGPGFTETPRDIAFCDHTIRGTGAMVVDDAAADPRFAANPMVCTDDGTRFYAGVPIRLTDRHGIRQPIGALCVTDAVPRSLNGSGRAALGHLAALAEALIAARATALEAIDIATRCEGLASRLSGHDRVFRQAERMAMIGSWRLSLMDGSIDWSEGVFRIHDLPVGPVQPFVGALDYYLPEARARISAGLTRTAETGAPFEMEEDFLTASGKHRRVRALAERESVDGVPTAIIGVLQDITDRYELETTLRRSADTDALTGLANRAAFDRALEAAIDRAQADGSALVLALIDLDGFKAINDNFGHTAGDDVLRNIGAALRADWLRGSMAARLGGDEFAVIVDDPALVAAIDAVGCRIEGALHIPIGAGPNGIASAGTVGIARLDPECTTVRDFVHKADTILYAAKRARSADRGAAPSRRTAAG